MENTAAIYCRLSKEDQDKINTGDLSESIVNQKMLLESFAKDNGLTVYKIYSDEDISGLTENRPAFSLMIKDAKKGRFGVVLCKSQSRFTRNMETLEKYIHGLFYELNIRFISLIDNIDTQVKGNKKARQINGLINEWYVEDLSENVRAVLRRKMEDGQFIGSFAAYGYKKDPRDRHKLIIDEYAADVVKCIFDMYINGLGVSEIAQRLTQQGELTPSAYKTNSGLYYNNPNAKKYCEKHGVWSVNTIRRILKNEMYTGSLVQGRYKKLSYKSVKLTEQPESQWIKVYNCHEAIIDGMAFEKARQIMNRNLRKHTMKNGSTVNLSGLVYCARCGSPFFKSGKTRDNRYYYLRCSLAGKTRNMACSPNYIKEDVLTEIISNTLRDIFHLNCDLTVKHKLSNVTSHKNQIAAINKKIANEFENMLNNIISQDVFTERKRALEKEKADIIKLISVQDNMTEKLDISSISHKYARFFIEKIIVCERVNNTRDIEIRWKITP
jgi:DNA invertase Pin-like site-specific DNA recombinase